MTINLIIYLLLLTFSTIFIANYRLFIAAIDNLIFFWSTFVILFKGYNAIIVIIWNWLYKICVDVKVIINEQI